MKIWLNILKVVIINEVFYPYEKDYAGVAMNASLSVFREMAENSYFLELSIDIWKSRNPLEAVWTISR